MGNFYASRPLTDEEQEIDWALEDHTNAMKDEIHALVAAGVFYGTGLLLVLIGSSDSKTERIGNALFACGLIMLLANIALGFRTRKYRRIAKNLVDPYMRRKAIPFYQELKEMFEKKPGVHLRLNDNGSITVTDKRNKKEVE